MRTGLTALKGGDAAAPPSAPSNPEREVRPNVLCRPFPPPANRLLIIPKRRKRPPVILGQMQKLSTSNGRLFSVSVEGPHLTLADTMVAAPRYLYILEAHFDGAADLLHCLRAWENGSGRKPGNMADDQNELIRRWVNAHDRADAEARQWLSQPDIQTFQVTLTNR